MTNPLISFRVTGGSDLGEWLYGRAERIRNPRGVNDQARHEIVLWRAAMAAELRLHRFTLGEICCVADVMNGSMVDAMISSGFSGIVYGAVVFEFKHTAGVYGRKWNIDEQVLLDKLANLGPVADHALRDALAQWWADDECGQLVPGFRKYGINVVPNPNPTPEQEGTQQQ